MQLNYSRQYLTFQHIYRDYF